ncbi:hypothetical protein IC575_002379 [Cucumis melo]
MEACVKNQTSFRPLLLFSERNIYSHSFLDYKRYLIDLVRPLVVFVWGNIAISLFKCLRP